MPSSPPTAGSALTVAERVSAIGDVYRADCKGRGCAVKRVVYGHALDVRARAGRSSNPRNAPPFGSIVTRGGALYRPKVDSVGLVRDSSMTSRIFAAVTAGNRSSRL